MNKAELVAAVAEKTNFTKKDAELAINALVASIEDALVKGDKVQLIGFGTFETRERKRRQSSRAALARCSRRDCRRRRRSGASRRAVEVLQSGRRAIGCGPA